MPHIEIHQDKAAGRQQELVSLCPFGAIENTDGKLSISAACRMCRLCIRKGDGVFEFVEDSAPGVDKSLWKGIAVVAEIEEGDIHPVTFELIGKAKELAAKVNDPVYCLMIGSGISEKANLLLEYGADEVFVYDQEELKHFRIEPYTAVMEDFINRIKPSSVLVGGTPAGRSLAPRAAARFRTGLTADCTKLDISESTDLDQIRPAYGGNIMAHINTPRHRPQFATVRYKIFSIPQKKANPDGKIHACSLAPEKLRSGIEITKTEWKSLEKGIEEAEVLVVAGRGVKKAEDIAMLQELASLLGGKVASTRAVVEAGWVDARCQIGLSGRTVKPKLLITCGVSGAIQFVAGMNSSEKIIAINTDENAPIFNVAHIGIKGDLYKIVPELIRQIKESRGEA
ncbi:MAG: electron transfer flavoprotein subunit alpha/FixB family protein [Lentisphaeria bacterium]|nr:electron transfer flavoprotein subunit alpha/FixB family protein [Lentisphaeria bacterium]